MYPSCGVYACVSSKNAQLSRDVSRYAIEDLTEPLRSRGVRSGTVCLDRPSGSGRLNVPLVAPSPTASIPTFSFSFSLSPPPSISLSLCVNRNSTVTICSVAHNLSSLLRSIDLCINRFCSLVYGRLGLGSLSSAIRTSVSCILLSHSRFWLINDKVLSNWRDLFARDA